MAQGLERIPLAIDSDFQYQPVRAKFPDEAQPEIKLVSFVPDEVQVAAPAAQSRTVGQVTADTAYGFAKGAGSLVKGLGWLTNSDTLQQAGQVAEDFWGEKQTAELQRQLDAVGKAEGVTGTVSALWDNPGAIGDYIATSLPMMIPGMGVGSVGARGIVAFAGNSARSAALRGGATEAAAMQAGRIAAEKAAEKSAMRFAVGANMLGEGGVSGGVTGADVEQFMLSKGATPEQAKAEANKAALLAGAWTTAGAGIGAGMETRAMLGRLKDTGIKGLAKNVGKEALEEAIQNPGEDYASYQAKVKVDPTQTFDPGKSATLGAVTGGVMGAGFHAAGRIGERMSGKQDDGADDPIPAADIGAGPSGSGGVSGEFIPADPRSQLPPPGPGAGSTYDQGQALLPAPDTIEGDVLGPETLPPGQRLLEQPAIDGETSIQGGEFARPALPSTPPTERQFATARGLLNHSPKASPELLQRLMRVDQDMAAMLFNHWQGQKNGEVTGNETPQVSAQGDQGQGADGAGSGALGGQLPSAMSPTMGATASESLQSGGTSMAVGAAGPDAITPLDVEAHGAATSPYNARPQPTEAQKQAGNYAKGHIKFQGMDISVENPAGSVRSGKDEDGRAWETTMQHHYGYIKGTVGKDKDHLDVFMKSNAKTARTAFVIDQINPKTGKFDEHKIVFGADSEQDARATYLSNYEPGWAGLGEITAMPMEDFKAWIKSGKTKKPVAYVEPKEVRTTSRTPKTASSLLQAIVNRGGISREIMSDVGADPAGRYMPGLFTKTGTTDLSALAGYLFDEDGFHQIHQDSPIGPSRELEDLITRALGGEKILSTTAMEKGMQAEENAKLKEKAQRLGIKTVARKIEDIAADVARAEEESILDEETRLEEDALDAYNELVDALNAAVGEHDAEGFIESLTSRYQDDTYLTYLRNAIVAIKEKLNAEVQYTAKPDETATGQAGSGDETGRAQGGTDALLEEARPPLALSSQSEEELAARDRAAQAAEAQRLKDEQAAENKRQADAERESFNLTGSDRPADVLAAQGQGDIFAKSNQEPRAPTPVAESQAPATSEPGNAGVAPGRDGGVPDRQKDSKGNPIYKMGERVEYIDGHYKGRHGAISQVSPIRMVTVMLGTGARNEGETTYYYHVKTDNGADFMANPEEIQAETAKPTRDEIVLDPEVDGRPIEPEALYRSIGYARQSAEKSRAAAQRARKADMIDTHKRSAALSDEKAKRLQATWNGWSAHYPDEAEKIAPSVKPSVAPAQSTATGTETDPAAVLKAAGLVVTKGTTNNGKPVWNVSGNTKTHMDIIKRAGGRWYGPKKVWSFYNDDPSAAIAAKLPAPSPTIAGKPTIDMSDKSLEQIAASSQPAADKAKAELEARDQADEVDLGALFDEVLAEETAPKNGVAVGTATPAAIEMRNMGAEAFRTGSPRVVPDYFGASSAKEWYRGWDDANVGAGETAKNAAPRTATQAATSAAINTGKGLLDAIDGLGKLFGSNGSRLSMGVSFDEDTYAKAKPLFAQAVAHFKDAGADLKEAMRAVVRLVLDKFGPQVTENMKPYIVRFMEDVKTGNVVYDESKEAGGNGNDRGRPETAGTGSAGERDGGGNAAPRERLGGSPETGNSEGDRGAGAGRAGGGQSLDALGQENAGTGTSGQAGRSDQGRGGAVAPGEGARGSEPLAGRDRESATVRDRPGSATPGAVAGTASKTPSTEGVSVSGKSDFQITEEDNIGEGGQKTKARNNIAAIRLLKKLDSEDRKATPAEQKVLAKYVGWGGIKQIFDDAKADWAKERNEFKALVTDQEYAAARRSMLDAHYTSTDVVAGMWSAAAHLGFKGGRVLEPSVGVGNFFGMMPSDIRAHSQLYGVELDRITAQLAQNLYPSATVANMGYQDVELPSGSFDLAIGNPPFGDQTLYDKNHPELRSFPIHSFFFAKTLDKLRPGGVMQLVVSRYLMDNRDATGFAAREYLAGRAKLLGAIRLPYNAFLGNANTEVVTDIIFLQKLKDGETAEQNWSSVKDIETTHPKTGEKFSFPINEYFIAHPEMVLGTHAPTGKMRQANQYNVEPIEGESIYQGLGRAIANLPRDVMTPATKPLADIVTAASEVPDGTKVLGYYMAGNVVMQRQTDAMGKRQGTPVEFKDATAPKRAEAMIGLRTAVRDLMRAERSDAPDSVLATKRARLSKLYDAFQKQYGYINQQTNRRAFRDDPDLPLLESLEPKFDPGLGAEAAKKRGEKPRKPSAERADIFTKRVLPAHKEITTAASANDALIVSLNMKGEVDPEYMAELYGKPWDQIRAELGALIFHNPNGGWESADAYLSGNVKAKLKLAEAAAEKDPQYAPNVEALRAVIPADVPALKISVRLGSPWIPSDVMVQFASELWGAKDASIKFVKQVARWAVKAEGGDTTARTATWGVTYTKLSGGSGIFGADMILDHVANNRAIVIKENVGTSETPVWQTNERATEAIRAKAQEMATKFREWIWQDQDRRDRLAKIYNETYNTDKRRAYDGSHLTLPGSSSLIKLRLHQLNAVWRAIQDRVILLDHVVGAGKTYEMAAIAMELRRLGITRKPMFVVPNSLVRQWRDEFYKLYPDANVLAATEADFAKANRKRFMAKIATGDWDAVIVAHSSFKKVGMPYETEKAILDEQLKEISDAIEDMKRERGDKNVVRDMERIKLKLEERMKALADRGGKKDDTVSFDELGVDGLFVDEAHLFKNLFYYSQMRNVTGLGNPNGSGRAFDLFVKTRFLDQQYAGKALVGFATGTPVSNSLVEMFTMQRYLAWNKLKENGLHLLDAWAGVYGDVQQVYEVHPSGTGYRLSTRFAKFVNLPSLMELYRGFADVVTMDDLKQQAKDAGGVFPVPKIKGGKPRNIVAERSEEQRRFFGVPEFGRDDKGGIAFKYPAELFVRKSDKDGKWYPWLKDGSKIGNEGFDTEAEAEAERATLVKLPVVGWNAGSILHKFENLKQLTKDSKGKVNALSITNEARKAGLDYRLIDPTAPDFAGSKINLAVKEAVRIYHAWAADKGAQLMFCDLSVPKTARAAAASKDRNAYVRAPDGGLDQVKATVVTIEGVEASFLAVKRGGKGADGGYVLYDGLTGAHTGIAEHQKKDAVDALKAKIERDGLGWLEDMQDRYGEITDADIADYKDATGKEEEAGEEGDEGAISVAELMALAGGNTFSVYDDIKTKLIGAGIPVSEIAFIHDFDTAAKKNDLFKKVRAGDIRILLGSTEKMGAGMNVQERLVALHHLDAPWRPSDLEQREGRIVRQGNKLYERDPNGFEIELMRYGTRQTYDTRMWQIIEHKAAGVEQLRKAGDDLLEIDDVGGEAANAADMKAAASGNPLILDEIKLRNEVRSLEAQQFAHIQARANHQDKVRWYKGAPARAEKEIAEIQPMVDMADKNPADPFRYTTPDGKALDEKKDVALPLTTAFADAAQSKLGETTDAGQYRGLLIRFRKGMSGITAYLGSGAKPLPAADYGMEDKFSPSGLFTRLDNALERLKATIASVRSSAASAIDQVPKLEAEIAKLFAKEDALKDTRAKHRAVVSKLQKSGGGIELSPEMRAELDDAIAERTGTKGMESRAANSDLQFAANVIGEIRSVIDTFKEQFKGTEELDIRVVGSAAEIPSRYRPSPYAEGVFHDDAGLIYLIAGNLRSASGGTDTGRAFQVLMHEAVGHFGLARMMGERFKPILAKVMGATKAKGRVIEDIYQPGDSDYATVEAVRLRYPEATDEEIAQEVLARMAETDPGRTLFGYVRAVVRQWLRDMARAAGFELDVTSAELNDLVALASAYMRRGDNLNSGAMPSTGMVAASQAGPLLSEDLARQEKYLKQQAEKRGFEDVDEFASGDFDGFMAAAAQWREQNPADMLQSKRAGMESRGAAAAKRAPKESSRGMLDALLRNLGGELAAKITGPAYDKLTGFLGGKIPEGIKAGVVSDYGLDESYIDRRTGMQTETQKGARQTKTFVEGLMDLDRAQSRIAYQWLNNRGEEADRLMAQLPPESRQVLDDIKSQIAKLTIEAVRLGQIDAETAARNFMAYLHRSYEKYDLKTDDKTWKAERAKAIKILGDQYKGRGLKMEVDPDRIHSAKGWWEGEMKGKKVKVLKNEAGRYAFIAVGTATPAQYAGYALEGVWEIRSAKAANRITLWRDFTAEERQMMGELDEAKYAVARTLFMMQRDIEVGRFHEWVADEYAKMPEEADDEGLAMADASESMMRAFRPDEWVTVPAVKVPGTGVFKYGALAGMVVPGPVWNDIRQIGVGRYEPFGSAYASILRAWKLSKTALTPTTHVNNIMGNFVMADMHDVGARDITQAVRLMLAAAKGDKEAKALWDRFEESGATQGMFTTHELKKEVLDPLLKALREEIGMADGEPAILKVGAIMSLAFHGKLAEAAAGAAAAIKQSAAGRGISTVLNKAQDYYQNEDAVFRFAAFLKGIEDGKTDLESGKEARKAFLDYHINAPWINAMRGTAMPFIAFAYRAVPMLAETAARKPWKIAKYMIVAGGLNALAYAMLGADGDEDKERAFLPEEKAGRLWGIVPKLIRMPWNRESAYRDGRKSIDPVFLDVRRWIPVGDVVDYGQDKTALPLIPQPLMPGGPLIIAGEFLVNKSAFTGKELTKETDTWIEKAAKVGGHFYKGFAPNVPVPYSGTWAGTKIDNAIKGKEDPLGRAYPVPEAIASGFGMKLERYPIDSLRHNAALDMRANLRELDDERRRLGRDYSRKGIERIELDEGVTTIAEKKRKLAEEFKAKEARSK